MKCGAGKVVLFATQGSAPQRVLDKSGLKGYVCPSNYQWFHLYQQ